MRKVIELPVPGARTIVAVAPDVDMVKFCNAAARPEGEPVVVIVSSALAVLQAFWPPQLTVTSERMVDAAICTPLPESLVTVPLAAAAVGLSFPQLIEHLVKTARVK